MNWNEQFLPVGQPPAPIRLGRWVWAGILALLLGGGLFLFYAAQPESVLAVFNVWTMAISPLLIVMVTFCLRGLFYIGASGYHRDCQNAAQGKRLDWHDWAEQALTVCASCVLLPDQVSASVLMQGAANLPVRKGVARRMTQLPEQKTSRAEAGLKLLQPALADALKVLPSGQRLRITLLSDAPDDQEHVVRDVWSNTWAGIGVDIAVQQFSLVSHLPYDAFDTRLQHPCSEWELMIVLQTQGGAGYSDGLAMLLMAPQSRPPFHGPSAAGHLVRAMPLDTDKLDRQLPVFMQGQACARQATALMADSADWQSKMPQVISLAREQGAALQVQQQWVQESLCGIPGPFSNWLMAALTLEIARHRQAPVLMLTRQKTQHWINTVMPGNYSTNA